MPVGRSANAAKAKANAAKSKPATNTKRNPGTVTRAPTSTIVGVAGGRRNGGVFPHVAHDHGCSSKDNDVPPVANLNQANQGPAIDPETQMHLDMQYARALERDLNKTGKRKAKDADMRADMANKRARVFGYDDSQQAFSAFEEKRIYEDKTKREMYARDVLHRKLDKVALTKREDSEIVDLNTTHKNVVRYCKQGPAARVRQFYSGNSMQSVFEKSDAPPDTEDVEEDEEEEEDEKAQKDEEEEYRPEGLLEDEDDLEDEAVSEAVSDEVREDADEDIEDLAVEDDAEEDDE